MGAFAILGLGALAWLLSKAKGSSSSTPTPSTTTDPDIAEVVKDPEIKPVIKAARKGLAADRTYSVRQAQLVLNRLGAKLATDGLYGPATQRAWAAAATQRKWKPAAAYFARSSSTVAIVHRDVAAELERDAGPLDGGGDRYVKGVTTMPAEKP